MTNGLDDKWEAMKNTCGWLGALLVVSRIVKEKDWLRSSLPLRWFTVE